MLRYGSRSGRVRSGRRRRSYRTMPVFDRQIPFGFEEDYPHEECGVIGVFAPNEDVARMTFFGLYALQHRGQEAAGIAVADGQTMSIYNGGTKRRLCNRSYALFDNWLLFAAERAAVHDRNHPWSIGAGA